LGQLAPPKRRIVTLSPSLSLSLSLSLSHRLPYVLLGIFFYILICRHDYISMAGSPAGDGVPEREFYYKNVGKSFPKNRSFHFPPLVLVSPMQQFI